MWGEGKSCSRLSIVGAGVPGAPGMDFSAMAADQPRIPEILVLNATSIALKL